MTWRPQLVGRRVLSDLACLMLSPEFQAPGCWEEEVIQLSRIHFRHSWCHRIRKSCLFPGKRIKYFFGRQVGRQVLNNCVRAHKEAEESGRYGGSKGIFEVSHPPASLLPPPPVSIGILSKWNQHNLSCSLIFHTE